MPISLHELHATPGAIPVVRGEHESGFTAELKYHSCLDEHGEGWTLRSVRPDGSISNTVRATAIEAARYAAGLRDRSGYTLTFEASTIRGEPPY
ncbi:hypothetical protein LCGC14_1555100 [marine sediment metagenome]|uniref:Uncharacterized protein n=1 Tax=marine sediment metagenome TaxID=412755 RepID=A0A0F9IP66_9ZZZZ